MLQIKICQTLWLFCLSVDLEGELWGVLLILLQFTTAISVIQVTLVYTGW